MKNKLKNFDYKVRVNCLKLAILQQIAGGYGDDGHRLHVTQIFPAIIDNKFNDELNERVAIEASNYVFSENKELVIKYEGSNGWFNWRIVKC